MIGQRERAKTKKSCIEQSKNKEKNKKSCNKPRKNKEILYIKQISTDINKSQVGRHQTRQSNYDTAITTPLINDNELVSVIMDMEWSS